MYVFDGAVLFPFAAIIFQRFHLRCERPQQPIGAVCEQLYARSGLPFHCGDRQKLHGQVVNALLDRRYV